ncbi:hypothetical protein BASA81_008101 [Batrachochytrium salamandrivorans]|nr:hypothetical protein BASA81_008101 [Batrachochytrium salamandrivorans]
MKRFNPPASGGGGTPTGAGTSSINASSSTSKLDSLASRALHRVAVGFVGGSTAAGAGNTNSSLGFAITPNQMAVASSIFYSVMSIAMILANKLILTTYQFDFPNVLLLLQCVMSLGLVFLGSQLGVLHVVDKIEKDKLLQWLPVNVFFLLMLLSGFYSLKYMSVPMFMVFKNTNNVLVTIGDWFLFDQPVTGLIVWSLVLLIIATLLSAKEDLEYTYEGYIWTAVNMVSSTGYLLYLRYAMNRTRLTQIGMVVHNNFLSVPLILAADFVSKQDVSKFAIKLDVNNTYDWWFFFLFLFNGIVGSLLSLASFFCVQATSPTTFSMVGALNKIPMAFLGVYMFGAKMTWLGVLYVGLSLVSGGLYAMAKVKQHRVDNAATVAANATVETTSGDGIKTPPLDAIGEGEDASLIRDPENPKL